MIETPSVNIDLSKVQQNIADMSKAAQRNGVKLRPHIKTHKIPDIAKWQLKEGAQGISVAKTTEAMVMADAGVEDIFIAYPVITDSALDRVLQLNRDIRLIVGVDSVEGARRLSAKLKEKNQTIEIRVEIDTGLKRTGIPYEEAVHVTQEIRKFENLNITGIYTFRGAVLQGEPTMDLEAAGMEEGKLMVDLATKLRGAGIAIEDVSTGSTPTAKYVSQVEGVTEIRPGTYVFYDRMQSQYGLCSYDDCAATVKATVVSKPASDLVVIDGGSKTFATDVQPNTPPLRMQGFGEIKGYPNAVFERMTEEHGIIRIEDSDVNIGDTLDIIPNHICSTVNLHNFVYMIDEAGGVQKERVEARGKLQ